jgi:hypothetical protein
MKEKIIKINDSIRLSRQIKKLLFKLFYHHDMTTTVSYDISKQATIIRFKHINFKEDELIDLDELPRILDEVKNG